MSESDFRKPLTIDSTQVSGNLTNFPVTVHLKNDSDLSNNAQSSGDDIRFKDSNGNQLSHEIESYDGSTGTLWAHVKIPSLSSSSDTTIFIFYGDANASNQQNASDVWTDGYEAVYHLNEKASGTGTADVYQDSTANNNDGDDFVSASGQGGQINEGQEFDGVDDFIQAPDYGDLSDWTLELWLNPTDWTPGDIQTFFFDAVVQGGEISFRIRDDSGQNRIEIGGGAALGGHLNFNVSGVTGWHSVAYTQDRDSNTRLGYFDGAQYGSFTSTNVADLDGTDVTIGGNGKNIRFYDGLIDEVRISSITRSPAAISTTFNNLDDPLRFLLSAHSPVLRRRRSLEPLTNQRLKHSLQPPLQTSRALATKRRQRHSPRRRRPHSQALPMSPRLEKRSRSARQTLPVGLTSRRPGRDGFLARQRKPVRRTSEQAVSRRDLPARASPVKPTSRWPDSESYRRR